MDGRQGGCGVRCGGGVSSFSGRGVGEIKEVGREWTRGREDFGE